MTSEELRKRFIDFFETKGHKLVPSSSLLPDDPSVLLTTAGMQQFKKYFTGELDAMKDFGSRRTVSIQKCFRTGDIDEVGDATHLTFFEMLGNFSFGDYFKKEAIAFSFEFLTSPTGLNLDPNRLYATAFKGDEQVPRDDETIAFWQERFKSVGIEAKIGERIFLYGREKNWWEAGLGPAGPDGEMFYETDIVHDDKFGPTCHPNCDCGHFVEIGNDVFMQYKKTAEGVYEPLENKGIDNGRGFERLAMFVQGKKSIFDTDLFDIMPEDFPAITDKRIKRIMLDHARSIPFLITDGVRPSNKDQGYILRRLIRRMIAHFIQIDRGSFDKKDVLDQDFIDIENLLKSAIKKYQVSYSEMDEAVILSVFREENNKFCQAIRNGLRELKKIETLDAKKAFSLFESFGLTFEIIKDFAGEKSKDLKREDFDKEFEKHQEISRAGAEKKFGGHGLILDTGELKAGNEEEMNKVLRLHTATHLLHQALRDILGDSVRQMGSEITPERTRFDFAVERKVTPEEISLVEKIANEKVAADYPMRFQEMPKAEAEKTGALHFFKAKYPDTVKVYYAGPADKDVTEAYSKEFCGGPHVAHTGEIGKIKIIKEIR